MLCPQRPAGRLRRAVREHRRAAGARGSGVNRGQREHKVSFRGYPQKGAGAVFS